MNSILSHRHARALGLLTLFALALWSRVLFTGQVLLPGAMLSGFAPFGGNAQTNATAPWTILQWDSLAQYYPWRHFAAQELRAGHIPLWNPFEFCGTPFVANAQSAVFYPLNLPFWIFDTAYAFGVAAWLHSLLAMFATYFLCQRWRLSRAASVVAAVAFAGCGYLAAWVLLPTLFATASWLPLCLLLFEKASDDGAKSRGATWGLMFSLSCALLAGHAQIFFYIVLALALRQMFLRKRGRGFVVLIGVLVGAALLAMIQILPTLELARYGHRAADAATPEAWQIVKARALQLDALPSLFIPGWPALSFDENFGYIGIGVALLAIAGVFWRGGRSKPVLNRDVPVQNQQLPENNRQSPENNRDVPVQNRQLPENNRQSPENNHDVPVQNQQLPENNRDVLENNQHLLENRGKRAKWFALALAIFGLLYALATPIAELFFFGVPGVSQMGTPGRALVLWSLGAALLCGYGVDFLRAKLKSSLVPAVALLIVGAELGFNSFTAAPTAPRAQIYPTTTLTTWLQGRVDENNRVLFTTPRTQWLPTEAFRPPQTHPIGVMPPNGALVYRLHEVNGYDSLSLRQYRAYISGEEFTRIQGQDVEGVSPQLNGNMVLINNLNSPVLDELSLRYIVVPQSLNLGANTPKGKIVFSANGCNVWERPISGQLRINGAAFSPGWKNGGYNPETFRFGAFVSLCALGLLSAGAMVRRKV